MFCDFQRELCGKLKTISFIGGQTIHSTATDLIPFFALKLNVI